MFFSVELIVWITIRGNLLLRALKIASPGTYFQCSNRIFRLSSLISGERCERKIPKKNPGIPLTGTYQSSHLTFDLSFRIRGIPKSRTLQMQKCQDRISYILNLVSGAAYESNILKKTPMFLLVISIDGVIYEIFHLNHHKWRNENETTTPNWRTGEITCQRWSGKSANVEFFYCLQLPEYVGQFAATDTSYCNTK